MPAQWQDQTRNPRGAIAKKGVPPVGYAVRDKAELWADAAADLYEEAIQRRWRASTDIAWDTLEELPEELEKAMCQLCTALCEKALLAGDVVGLIGLDHVDDDDRDVVARSVLDRLLE